MVGRWLDENEHVTDSTWARLTENKGSSRQISNIRHVSQGSCTCLQYELCTTSFVLPSRYEWGQKELREIKELLSKSTGTKLQHSVDTWNSQIIVHPLWCPKLSPLGSSVPDYNRCIQLIDRIKNTTNSRKERVIRSEIMALGPKVTSIKSNKL